MKFASFDLEIANDLPEDGSWSKELGITCAAIAYSEKEMDYYFGKPQLVEEQAITLVSGLQNAEYLGYKIVTWNGVKFDFRVLADVSGMYEECAQLAMNHLDMMLWVTFQKGYYLGLQAALKGAGLEGKLKEVTLNSGEVITDMDGAKAPEMWRNGEYDAVLAYLELDVVQPLKLVHYLEDHKILEWTSKKGNLQKVGVPKLWNVKECFQLPEPYTGWMSDPPKREDFVAWMPK